MQKTTQNIFFVLNPALKLEAKTERFDRWL